MIELQLLQVIEGKRTHREDRVKLRTESKYWALLFVAKNTSASPLLSQILETLKLHVVRFSIDKIKAT